MAINSDKTNQWKADVTASVDLFNSWFMRFAPKAYRDTRVRTTSEVEKALVQSRELRAITPEVLRAHPAVVPTLRMSTAPPIARDRLVGLAGVKKSLVESMEEGRLPPRMKAADLNRDLKAICDIITKLLDRDIFPWLEDGSSPTQRVRERAATIVADRLCGATADPIVRNAQEQRQLALFDEFLTGLKYRKQSHSPDGPLTEMAAGTFAFRMVVLGKADDGRKVNIPIDVVIQPKTLRPSRLPILIEAKSAGDFTNVNKRRKEEATKIRQLKAAYGPKIEYLLFLCGYFDTGYLGYEAAEGIDWIWEHRMNDLMKLGL